MSFPCDLRRRGQQGASKAWASEGGNDLSETPDLIEPIRAFRSWRMKRDGSLHALNGGHLWKPGENVAVCGSANIQMGYYLYRGPSPADTWYMEHALTDLEYPVGSGRFAKLPRPREAIPQSLLDIDAHFKGNHDVPSEQCACGFWGLKSWHDWVSPDGVRGIVEMYGRVVEGDNGWRAQKAKIIALIGDAKELRKASDYYEVPVYARASQAMEGVNGYREDQTNDHRGTDAGDGSGPRAITVGSVASSILTRARPRSRVRSRAYWINGILAAVWTPFLAFDILTQRPLFITALQGVAFGISSTSFGIGLFRARRFRP